jgi:hypothetical protein
MAKYALTHFDKDAHTYNIQNVFYTKMVAIVIYIYAFNDSNKYPKPPPKARKGTTPKILITVGAARRSCPIKQIAIKHKQFIYAQKRITERQ